MTSHIKFHGAMRLDTHRIMELEADDWIATGGKEGLVAYRLCDEACAQEGGLLPNPQDENQGDGPIPKATKPSKAERTEVAKFWRLFFVSCVALFASFLLVHWGVPQ